MKEKDLQEMAKKSRGYYLDNFEKKMLMDEMEEYLR